MNKFYLAVTNLLKKNDQRLEKDEFKNVLAYLSGNHQQQPTTPLGQLVVTLFELPKLEQDEQYQTQGETFPSKTKLFAAWLNDRNTVSDTAIINADGELRYI